MNMKADLCCQISDDIECGKRRVFRLLNLVSFEAGGQKAQESFF